MINNNDKTPCRINYKGLFFSHIFKEKDNLPGVDFTIYTIR